MSYPVARLREEVAYLSMGLGWKHDEILALTHRERQAWVRTVNQIRSGQAQTRK
ncbi:DUF6760 family protein [Candidatus Flexifilum breve]|uniref:DUF6760 family protein n=1 Tax=Candidatus Flexifilum breve TaxID=3140694 RepID=UPI0031CCC385